MALYSGHWTANLEKKIDGAYTQTTSAYDKKFVWKFWKSPTVPFEIKKNGLLAIAGLANRNLLEMFYFGGPFMVDKHQDALSRPIYWRTDWWRILDVGSKIFQMQWTT